jgi:hypothetical protein
MEDLLEGHPISEKKMKEVLGHTPLQVCWVSRQYSGDVAVASERLAHSIGPSHGLM